IVSTGFVATVSPGRLPSAPQDRAPGYGARFVENQLHAPRAANEHPKRFAVGTDCQQERHPVDAAHERRLFHQRIPWMGAA
ncbi:MAG: hypothetical protein WAM79_11450, partial [Candidatus Sulfotelmatobacter sp.]